MDAVALVPVVGGIKYVDEASAVIKSGAKYGDEIADTANIARKADKAIDAAKAVKKIKYPGNNPTKSPGKGFEWRGKSDPSSGKGNWYNPKTKERWNPDLNHGDPIGPHWDYRDSAGNQYRVFPDGHIEYKK